MKLIRRQEIPFSEPGLLLLIGARVSGMPSLPLAKACFTAELRAECIYGSCYGSTF
jgi:hypothetical protein